MFTSFSIVCSWLDSSQFTDGLPRSVTNCFVSNVEAHAFMKRTCLGTIWHIHLCVSGLSRSIMCHFQRWRLLLSSDERVWVLPVSTTGCPVLSFLTVSSWKERESISWERDGSLAPCAWLVSRQTTGCPVPSWSGFGFGWFDWKLLNCCTTCPSGRWPTSFSSHVSKRSIGRRPRWRICFLVYDFSSFHPNNFRNTIRWTCFVKNDRVRSSLIELQSFLQSSIDVDQKKKPCSDVSSMLYACIVHDTVHSNRSYQDLKRFLSMRSTGRKNAVSLLFKFWPPGINPELMMECTLIAHLTW